MNKINELTSEQNILLQKTIHYALNKGRSTEPINQPLVESVITKLYAKLNKKAPEFLKFPSPFACLEYIKKLKKQSKITSEIIFNSFRGNQRPYIWVFAKFAQKIGVNFSLEESEHLDLWYTEWHEAHWWFPYEELVLLSERPIVCCVDELGRLHKEDGPALKYSDGYSVYSWHGVRVDKLVIEHPEFITVNMIQNESNAEIRRVMLTKYGEARYLEDAGAKLIHEDEFGKLYSIEIPNDEPLVMVKVVNSTPEFDGTYKTYTLRVKPDCKTAQEAVASTWRWSDTGELVFPQAHEYVLDFQS